MNNNFLLNFRTNWDRRKDTAFQDALKTMLRNVKASEAGFENLNKTLGKTQKAQKEATKTSGIFTKSVIKRTEALKKEKAELFKNMSAGKTRALQLKQINKDLSKSYVALARAKKLDSVASKTRIASLGALTVAMSSVLAVSVSLINIGLKYNQEMDVAAGKLRAMVSINEKYMSQLSKNHTEEEKVNHIRIRQIEILERLKIANRKTTMGLGELVDVYATAKPAMDNANWALETQIDVIERVSNAASNYGIYGRTLTTGIDDLARGTWRANSEFGKMLKSMGITKDAFKEAGYSAEWLMDKIGGAGEMQHTWANAVVRSTEALRNFLAEKTNSFFESMKISLLATIDALKAFKSEVDIDTEVANFTAASNMMITVIFGTVKVFAYVETAMITFRIGLARVATAMVEIFLKAKAVLSGLAGLSSASATYLVDSFKNTFSVDGMKKTVSKFQKAVNSEFADMSKTFKDNSSKEGAIAQEAEDKRYSAKVKSIDKALKLARSGVDKNAKLLKEDILNKREAANIIAHIDKENQMSVINFDTERETMEKSVNLYESYLDFTAKSKEESLKYSNKQEYDSRKKLEKDLAEISENKILSDLDRFNAEQQAYLNHNEEILKIKEAANKKESRLLQTKIGKDLKVMKAAFAKDPSLENRKNLLNKIDELNKAKNYSSIEREKLLGAEIAKINKKANSAYLKERNTQWDKEILMAEAKGDKLRVVELRARKTGTSKGLTGSQLETYVAGMKNIEMQRQNKKTMNDSEKATKDLAKAEGELRNAMIEVYEVLGMREVVFQAKLQDNLNRLREAGIDSKKLEEYANEFKRKHDEEVKLDQLGYMAKVSSQAQIEQGQIRINQAVKEMNELGMENIEIEKVKARMQDEEIAKQETLSGGMMRYMLSLKERAEEYGKLMNNVMTTIEDGIAGGLNDWLRDSEDGMKSFKDAAKNTFKSILRGIQELIVKQLVLNSIQAIGGGFGFTAATGGPVPQKLAVGGTFIGSGRVPGYDASDSDKVNAKLTGGEFVLKREAVDEYGLSFLTKLNNKSINKYADGGLVTPTTVTPRPSIANSNNGGANVTIINKSNSRISQSTDSSGSPVFTIEQLEQIDAHLGSQFQNGTGKTNQALQASYSMQRA